MTVTPPACPRCNNRLDGGPILFYCSACSRSVYAADLNAEARPRQVVPAVTR